MRVKILNIKDNGNIKKERVVLKILTKTDIGNYLVCDTTYRADNSVSNKLRHVFWFPDKILNEGDFVALYTRAGTDRAFENKAGTTTHRFHWGLDTTVWNEAGDGAVVFHVDEWGVKKVLPAK